MSELNPSVPGLWSSRQDELDHSAGSALFAAIKYIPWPISSIHYKSPPIGTEDANQPRTHLNRNRASRLHAMKLSLFLAAAPVASAHTIFQNLVVGGKDFGKGVGVRIPSYNGPIQDVTSDSLACNGAPNPTTGTPTVIDVRAGDEVTALWRCVSFRPSPRR
jgi:hypothetical protein